MTDGSTDRSAPSAHESVPTITRDELVAALQSARPPALFEVLPTGYWKKHHLPGALNAPPEQAVAIITAQVPDHDADIVVYCWDPG
jgi:rhodanese-related sulfurtransferase